MNKNTIIQMIKIGWNLDEIYDLIRESKETEKSFVAMKIYDNERKITDFSKIEKYYCTKHQCFHRKYRNKQNKVKTDSFKKCKEKAIRLTTTEIQMKKFRSNFVNYFNEKHKNTIGSRKQ